MTAKKLGIWMDHEQALLTAFTIDPMKTTTIASSNTHTVKQGEHHMHSKDKHQLEVYYKELGEEILHYQEVLLFGPTSAKSELVNSLEGDHRFGAIKIKIEPADKMTENQLHAFVRKYFSKH